MCILINNHQLTNLIRSSSRKLTSSLGLWLSVRKNFREKTIGYYPLKQQAVISIALSIVCRKFQGKQRVRGGNCHSEEGTPIGKLGIYD